MNILVISPHPDDAEYGIGGCLLKLRENNSITILYNTKYDLVDNKYNRNDEARKSCLHLNAKYDFFNYEDDIQIISEKILYYKPDVIFLPFYDDLNSVHLETTKKMLLVIENLNIKENNNQYSIKQIIYYETYSSLNFKPSIIFDVSSYYAQSVKLLNFHKEGQETLRTLKYKFELMHKLYGLEIGTMYGEGIFISNHGFNKWKKNRVFLINIVKQLYE